LPQTDLSNEEITTRLGEALLDGVAEVPAWETFLPMLRRLTCADGAFILLEPRLGGSAHPVAFTSGASEDRILELHQQGIFGTAHCGVPDGETPQSFIGTHGAGGHASLAVAVSSGSVVHLGLWWHDAAALDPAAAALMQKMALPLERAIRIFLRIADVERRAAMFETVVDHADIGVLLVTPRGQVSISNDVARDMLAQTDALRIEGHRLTVSDERAHRWLMCEIARAIAGQVAGTQHRSVPASLKPEEEGAPLTAIVYPGPRHAVARGPMRNSAIIMLRDSDRRSHIPVHNVANLLRLTPAEAALATRLSQGFTLAEIADLGGVKHNTLRSQLQTIYSKTGAKRQGDLVRLICNSTAALS
jgi:DNA-binding CsgD family transcriptional regulator/PAS domain-containing protein